MLLYDIHVLKVLMYLPHGNNLGAYQFFFSDKTAPAAYKNGPMCEQFSLVCKEEPFHALPICTGKENSSAFCEFYMFVQTY